MPTKMEGLDRTWYDNGRRTTNNLPKHRSGKYIFRVKAWLKNGEWMKKILHPYTLSLIRRFGQIWYAKSLYTLLILCIIYLIFRSYKKKTAAEEFFKGGEKTRWRWKREIGRKNKNCTMNGFASIQISHMNYVLRLR